jgi:hypothetical protein
MYIPVDSRYLSTASFEVGAFCIENVIKRLNIDILKYKDRSILIKQQTFPVLPDGIFSYQESQFGNMYFGMENVGIFFIHSTCLWPFGIFYFLTRTYSPIGPNSPLGVNIHPQGAKVQS